MCPKSLLVVRLFRPPAGETMVVSLLDVLTEFDSALDWPDDPEAFDALTLADPEAVTPTPAPAPPSARADG